MSKNSMHVRTLILTSDPGNWCLQPMAYLWNKYVGKDWPVTVAGFSALDFELPDNFEYVSLGKFADFPVDRWGDALYQAVELVGNEPFIFLLEDFWPVRHVDRTAILLLKDYLLQEKNTDVLRIDLTADRLNAIGTNGPAARDLESVGHLDIIEALPPAAYQMSTMAAIWRPGHLRSLIERFETPWEFEIQGSTRVNQSGFRVLGTRNFPFRHTIAVQKGRPDFEAAWMVPPAPVRREDIEEMFEIGIMPKVFYPT